MSTAYSQDLRDLIIAARDRGLATKQVAVVFEVSASWVRRVMHRRREHGETAPRPRVGITMLIDPKAFWATWPPRSSLLYQARTQDRMNLQNSTKA